MYGVPLAIIAAFPFLSDFLPHIIQNTTYDLSFVLFCLFVRFFFCFLSSFLFFFSFFVVWLGLLCSRTRYASTSLALP